MNDSPATSIWSCSASHTRWIRLVRARLPTRSTRASGSVAGATSKSPSSPAEPRAKLNLALALLADPDVLSLDEPYTGFDWDTYVRFWELTAQRRAAGRSVLVVSHFVTDEERFDRVVEMREGKAMTR